MALIRRSVWAAVALCAVFVSGAQAESVWDAMRAPGSVVVLRHSYAPGGFDPPDARLEDCSSQRNLDENGRAQAARIGEAFRKNAIAVGKVLSSPRCRCLDTARLAFGSVVTDLTGLNIRMGEFVVLRRAPDGTHALAGQFYVE